MAQIDWSVEQPLILAECAKYGAGAFLAPILQSIRVAEDGGPGRQFGVLSVSAPTYAEQLHIACATVIHRLWSYPGNPLTTTADDVLRVSDAWVAYFASIWSPQGAANDPQGLNKNWVKNFLAAYNSFLASHNP